MSALHLMLILGTVYIAPHVPAKPSVVIGALMLFYAAVLTIFEVVK